MKGYAICDICHVQTRLYPKHEIIKKTIVKKVKVQDQTIEIPSEEVVYAEVRVQDPLTGGITKVPIPKKKLLEEQSIEVRVSMGTETIVKDFCSSCYSKHIKKYAEKLWETLEKTKSH